MGEKELQSAGNVKLICVTATGYDNIDVEYCKAHGIAVCNVSGYSTNSVAQLTVSVVLSLSMHLREFEDFVNSGEYTKSGIQNRLSPTFHEIAGKTWGIAGYGNIGKKVADVARALGAEVIAYKNTPVDGVRCVDIETISKEADILTIHLPLTDKTRGIFGEDEIALMKKNAIIVNMARGAVIDEKAFAGAIKSGKIGAFGTDVYSVEPMSEDSPFVEILNYPNTLFTPHMAWGAFESRARCMEEIAKNITAFYEGKTRNRVDL